LVSFFFTPIYMFMLVYLATFGVKKGSVVAYLSSWDFCFNNLTYTLNQQKSNLKSNLGYRFQYTSVTSRSTSYFLMSFWLFFFFYGETLLLIVFNYSTTTDTISSASFLTLKQHIIFFLTTTPVKLVSFINFYIVVLTFSAFMYLTNLNYTYNYMYYRLSFYNSTLITLVAMVWVIS
jgi:hypothetical protein